MENSFEIIVLGAGPGGYVAAIRAAQLGLKTAIIEEKEFGGTCLNRGCIPTKAFLHAAQTFKQIQEAASFGIKTTKPEIDATQLYEYKNGVVDTLRTGIMQLLQANKVTCIQGKGKITDKNTVRVLNQEGLSADYLAEKILIATGSIPVVPNIVGIDTEGVYTSDDLLAREGKLFDSVTIIGGGVIGVEFASIYRSFGCEVTIIEAMDSLLPMMDRDFSQNLSMIFKKRGIKVITGARVEEIKKEEKLSVVYHKKNESGQVDTQAVLVAIGRKANTNELFASEMAPETLKERIITDEHFLTSIENVYAIGDASSTVQLAHVASAQGIYVAERLAGQEPHIDLSIIPSCVYCEPEIASVGITAQEAKDKEIRVLTGKYITTSMGKSLIHKEERGFVKLVVQEDTKIVLGAQLMCAHATDMIGELSTAIANKLTVAQLLKAMKAHPSFNEAIAEALEDINDGAIHAAPKRKR